MYGVGGSFAALVPWVAAECVEVEVQFSKLWSFLKTLNAQGAVS